MQIDVQRIFETGDCNRAAEEMDVIKPVNNPRRLVQIDKRRRPVFMAVDIKK